jgi:phosphonate metabolism protein PhnN/1,5-bisphosphokinase (PRPP-forming)
VVTRAIASGSESSLSEQDFAAAEKAGAFLLSWQAHGLAYGIPIDLQEKRDRGITVIANVSRQVVEPARRRLSPVSIIVVTAPAVLLAKRLTGRSRENGDQIAERLRRGEDPLPDGPDVHWVDNDQTLVKGIRKFVAALRRISAADD